ncbi:MAG: BLUF domain-containing protein [Burkholderiaceae bacterium]|nr:BLUF domain-containing protein [Burkholderiaceae bacterium]
MSDLKAIAYVSSATQLMTVAQLESLLVEARDLNLESGVTGVLLYSDGNFMQYFEGSEESMRVTYERIRASQRHKDIMEILNERIAQRSFPDWQMGFAQATQSELLALSTARWQRMAGEARDSSAVSPGLALLQNFWRRARK